MANVQLVTGGPYGGPGGKHWDDGGTYTTVRKLIVQFGTEIYSIQVDYDVEGQLVSKERHGGNTGTSNEVKLNYPTEYLISISGHYGYSPQKYLVVKSLTIQSNVKQYGPYGVEEGTPFITPVTTGKIVGFFGRNAGYLDSIGVYIKPVGLVVGPFGTTAGQPWNDGKYNTVSELTIHFGSLVNSIQVVYDIEGKPILGEKHGSDGGTLNTVKLEPDEYLVSFWGYYGQVGNIIVVRSLGFQSNKRRYGPFGVEEGERFDSPSSTGKIIGFHGRSNGYLNAIGAYLDE